MGVKNGGIFNVGKCMLHSPSNTNLSGIYRQHKTTIKIYAMHTFTTKKGKKEGKWTENHCCPHGYHYIWDTNKPSNLQWSHLLRYDKPCLTGVTGICDITRCSTITLLGTHLFIWVYPKFRNFITKSTVHRSQSGEIYL